MHRDLKPENVILEPLRRGGDFVKVVDFGLAKLRADAQAPSNVTSPGIVCGTPDYMAPEQGRGDAIDGRSDLYSVGVMLFQLLTGRLPYEADNPTQVVMMHLTIPVPDPRQVAPSARFETLVAVVFRDGQGLRAIATMPQSSQRCARPRHQSIPELHAAEQRRTARRCRELPGWWPAVALTRSAARGAWLPARSGAPEIVTTPVSPLPMVGREDDMAWLEQAEIR